MGAHTIFQWSQQVFTKAMDEVIAKFEAENGNGEVLGEVCMKVPELNI